MGEPVVREFESLEGMPQAAADGLRQLLWALADTKLLLGYHYGEWTFGTPELEAAVASCSLSQAELGHVRLLHALLRKHWGEDPDALVEVRAVADFANITFLDAPIGDWPACVVMNAVVDLTATRVLATLHGSSFRPLRMSVDKMLDEERHHAHHGIGWFRTLGRRGGDGARAICDAAERALAAAALWLGPAGEPGDAALVAAGVKSTGNAEILAGLIGDVTAMADQAGITVLAPAPASFAHWNPNSRRGSAGGPAEDIVFHLRGAANAMFKLGE
ncbi:MAG: phenylacetate-CoA oxygenase subunit PaaI [Gemmatimonadota bacterium]|nr:phenylacetate-CoA oxygenase subunit PaaI [Gemmatimonadota bacterium]MDH4351731.1 phenylacetate-CoA oxygenase subunit PaaI [Gemmatimonadota bacterium]MDH5196717.1 phenylacetate-CoA oxygenase subunit PaaI [Gemmatimonadota bacterium]